jgi:hypothetical protein
MSWNFFRAPKNVQSLEREINKKMVEFVYKVLFIF